MKGHYPALGKLIGRIFTDVRMLGNVENLKIGHEE